MFVREIMTHDPKCCAVDTSLRDVAVMMSAFDCGEIPAIDTSGRPVGVVTDRDITCRSVAHGRNPLELSVRDVMSSPVITVRPDTTIEDCCKVMERAQVRRIPVIDAAGRCCGMVSQADIALKRSREEIADVVRLVSRPSDAPSSVRPS